MKQFILSYIKYAGKENNIFFENNLKILKQFQILQFFVRLDHIRKCFTQKGGIFVLEEYSK